MNNKSKMWVILVIELVFLSSSAYGNVALDAVEHVVTKREHSVSRQAGPSQAVKSPYALVLFFRSTCPHCQRFVPGFLELVRSLKLPVFAYSTDGGALPSVPHPLLATPQVMNTFFADSQRMVPSVFVINTRTMAFQLLSQGEVAPNTEYQRLLPYSRTKRRNV